MRRSWFWPANEEAPISIRVVLDGPAPEIMRALRKIGSASLCAEAYVTSRILRDGDRRRFSFNDYPVIENGDNAKALERLETLSRQRLIEPEIERQLDDLFTELAAITRA